MTLALEDVAVITVYSTFFVPWFTIRDCSDQLTLTYMGVFGLQYNGMLKNIWLVTWCLTTFSCTPSDVRHEMCITDLSNDYVHDIQQ